jgi:hypothetical protein
MSKTNLWAIRVGGPTWVFAVRHAGRIAESIFALAETWPTSVVSTGVGRILVSMELATYRQRGGVQEWTGCLERVVACMRHLRLTEY